MELTITLNNPPRFPIPPVQLDPVLDCFLHKRGIGVLLDSSLHFVPIKIRIQSIQSRTIDREVCLRVAALQHGVYFHAFNIFLIGRIFMFICSR